MMNINFVFLTHILWPMARSDEERIDSYNQNM